MSWTKYNFICTNDDCENKFVNVAIVKEEGDEKADCLYCRKEMKVMGEVMYGGIGKFNSLPAAEKKKMLLKRSHNHFNRFIKDKKEQYNKNFNLDIRNLKK